MRRQVRRFAALAGAAMTLAALNSRTITAGGPYAVTASGEFVRWPNGGVGITFNPDQGGLGHFSHADAVEITEEAFGKWEAVPSATTSFINGGVLPVDVDATNAWELLFNDSDGLNPIVYDADGSITELYFGANTAVLGFGEIIATYETGEILDAWMVLNARFFGAPVARSSMLASAMHEVGHFVGLDHSVVNGQVVAFSDSTGPSPHDTFARPAVLDVETMYGVISGAGPDGSYGPLDTGQDTLHRDDIAAISTLYPELDFNAATATIVGRTLTPNGIPYSGVNVIARNLDNPFEDAVSAISGSLTAYPHEDSPMAGVFVLRGLTPGARYAVYVDALIGGFPGKRRDLPGPEEFYNGPAESGDPATDAPQEFTAVVPTAGVPLTGIDIVFNARPLGVIPPEAFVYGSTTGAVPVFPSMPIELCGQRFGHFLLNANGTLTFFDGAQPLGVHDLLLDGPARLAGLWAEFDPMGGGTIAVDETTDALTISFTDVPTVDGGANSFRMTLVARNGQPSRWITEYGHLDERGGIAGYSCGGLATSGLELETDLTAYPGQTLDGRGRAAIFEEFATSDNDLQNVSLTYALPGRLDDPFEPNDSVSAARSVSLPFHTAGEFTAIGPGDVDVYRFKVKRGQIVVTEVMNNAPTLTAIELFQIAPNGSDAIPLESTEFYWGAPRIVWAAPADGDYAVAVTGRSRWYTTYPSRYVLNIASYSGRVLPLGDDDSIEVPLGFSFPYQGAAWSSVWVNSDGNLTFGQPDAASTARDLTRFLAGPPRIAPLFADLDPTGTFSGLQGYIIAEERPDLLTVHWASVQRFAGGVWSRTNSVSVTLRSDGTVSTAWGLLDRDKSAIVGVTQGGNPVHPQRADLSHSRNVSVIGTTYEDFILSVPYPFPVHWPLGPIDLSFRAVRFAKE